MTCRELADFLGEYVAGALSGDARRSFERHLALCVNCRRYLEQYRHSIELGRAAFDDMDAIVPGEVPEELVKAILAARRDS